MEAYEDSEGIHQILVSHAAVRKEPFDSASLESEVLFGERVDVCESHGEWVRITDELDGYSGYMNRSALSPILSEATHRVSESHAVIYQEPSFKTPRVGMLHMNSRVEFIAYEDTAEGRMHRIDGSGWIFANHAHDIRAKAPDAVTEALKSKGTPYEWGARARNLDCSSWFQQGNIAAGIPCARDCIPQSRTWGEEINLYSDFRNLRRGDAVFWVEGKGRHVVWMLDEENCAHCTIAYPYRKVVIQPLRDVVRDQRRDGNGVPTIARRNPLYRKT